MTKKELSEIKEVIQDSIDLRVNGKIDALAKRFTKHEEDMKPIIEGWHTINNIRSFVIWVAAPIAAVAGLLVLLL